MENDHTISLVAIGIVRTTPALSELCIVNLSSLNQIKNSNPYIFKLWPFLSNCVYPNITDNGEQTLIVLSFPSNQLLQFVHN
jgi:hypothetical protein